MSIHLKHKLTLIICMGLSAGAQAGTIVKSTYTADGNTSQSTVYSSPGRRRVDTGASRTIQECDQKRIVQYHEKTKTYVVLPQPAAEAAPATPPADAACESKPEATDTGEKKEILGLLASRWKTVLASCDGSKTELDGWYAGLSYAASCEAAPSAGAGAPGYPLAYTITTTDKQGKAAVVSYSVESLQLTSGPLEAALFEVPAESAATTLEVAAAVRNPEFIQAVATPKATGGTRVGVAAAGGKGTVDAVLAKMLKDAKVEAVPLGSGADAEVQARARQANVDFVLMTEVGEVKAGGGSKVGGVLSKASALAGSPERQVYTATVSYKLVPIGGGAQTAAGSAAGVTTQFGLREAIALGRLASMFTPLGSMMMQPGMGGMAPFLQMTAGGGGMGGPGYGMNMGLPGLMRSVDPGMAIMQPALQAGLQAAGSLGGEGQESAVSAAMEKIAKLVAVALKPAPPAAAAPAKGKGKKK